MFIVNLDKERHAKVTNKALTAFKQNTGKDILALKEGEILSLEDMEILLWLSLIKEDPDLKLETVQDEVELHQLKDFTAYIMGGQQPGNPI